MQRTSLSCSLELKIEVCTRSVERLKAEEIGSCWLMRVDGRLEIFRVFPWVGQNKVTEKHIPSRPGRFLFSLHATAVVFGDAIPCAIDPIPKAVCDREGRSVECLITLLARVPVSILQGDPRGVVACSDGVASVPHRVESFRPDEKGSCSSHIIPDIDHNPGRWARRWRGRWRRRRWRRRRGGRRRRGRR